MKLANPLQYPLAVLAGGIFLVGGVRLGRLPAVVVIPGAVIIATAGAAVLKSREPDKVELANKSINREFQQVRQQAVALGTRANELNEEATRLLTDSDQIELLGVVQYACDRTQELPQKIDQLAFRLEGKDALLSVDELQRQLKQAEVKVRNSKGIAQEQWGKLANSLKRNIALAQHGEDARQAQLANLSTLIAESGGVLQQLQNKLRTADLTNAVAADELRELSDEFKGFQENVDVLIA
ncbi:hypothetical protein N836_17420 [Leptolyngbya sp. Heron Island J]|uniref:hypothetical protein n=1 Tax=Leptolyngbya sp. Heron Island J TaxID=1385935 RepID=UPI0003B9EEAB|nr:hypothetical protein [Leptolyngbya sp. Heron Island J]ESA34405.1 hypothetical protein N836_17420 [Leptolyngbya sp. Heron Island J]